MIGPAGSLGGLLGALAGSSGAVRAQLDTALEQESTGHVADSYAGLGTGARTALDLAPSVAHLQTWQANIGAATTRLDVTQTTLSQIEQIASTLRAKTNDVNGAGYSEVPSVAADAKQALQQVAQLLNTTAGDTYVFSGQDTGNPPLTTTDPAALTAALLTAPPGTAPFSTTIGAVPTVEVGDGQQVQVGLLANQNTLVTSSGPGTTGSYMRDILTGIATLAGLVDGPGAQASAATAASLLTGGTEALVQEQGALGDIQSGLKARQASLAATQTTLTSQVSDVEDVDAAATLTKVQGLQAQLQASYELIAGVKGLTLTTYITA